MMQVNDGRCLVSLAIDYYIIQMGRQPTNEKNREASFRFHSNTTYAYNSYEFDLI